MRWPSERVRKALTCGRRATGGGLQAPGYTARSVANMQHAHFITRTCIQLHIREIRGACCEAG